MTTFFLITGFLGSGKTTLLKHLLGNTQKKGRVAVIQNEFAPNSIDGIELKQVPGEMKLVELNNGSVFCACLMGSFVETLKKLLAEYQPEVIYLEASGLADPSTLWQVLNDPGLKGQLLPGGSVCMVDAPNYLKALNKMPGVVQQIRIADLVVINKTDLVDETQLSDVVLKVKSLNPLAKVTSTSFSEIGPAVWDEISAKQNLLMFLPEKASGRPNIQSAAMKTSNAICAGKLDDFLKELSAVSVRAKGFVVLSNQNTILFQSVFGEFTVAEVSAYHGNSEITVIGENISPGFLRGLFEKYSC